MSRIEVPWRKQPQQRVKVSFNRMEDKYVWYPGANRATPVGNISTDVTFEGRAFNGSSSASNYWLGSNTKVISALDVWTMGTVINTFSGAVLGGLAAIGERGSSGNDIIKITFCEQTQTDNSSGVVIRNSAGTLNRINGTKVINDGRTHTVVASKFSATLMELWIDGVSQGTLTNSYPGSGFTGSTPLLIGNDLQGPTNASGISLAFVIPNFAWSPDVIQKFSDNPWSIFVPIESRQRLVSIASGFSAAWSRPGSRIIGTGVH